MNIRIIVESDEDIYMAYCSELSDCITYARMSEEAKEKVKEAIELNP